jgi:hypothetical protein
MTPAPQDFPAGPYRFTLRGEVIQHQNLVAISRAYAKRRDASGEGGSTFPGVPVVGPDNRPCAWVSYNARVWTARENGVCIFNPYG